MPTIGAFEAKTHFSQLLDKVAHGEEIIITRHGAPVAKLVSAYAKADAEQIGKLIAEIKELRKGQDRGRQPGTSIRELIDAGRKY
jgi:prevent-host-death family protein